MQRLVRDAFASQGEPYSETLADALAAIGCGYLAASLGTIPPIPIDTERREIAWHVVGLYLTGHRPSPTNLYLQELVGFGRAYLYKVQPAPPVDDESLAAVATVAMGAVPPGAPRAARAQAMIAETNLFLAGR